jgi:taurine dioxygenase
MQINKITNLIGAEVTGVDLSKPLTPEQRIELKNALLANYVLFFRDQIMEPEILPDVISQFGEIFIHTSEKKYKNHKDIGYIISDKNSTFNQIEGKTMHSDRTSIQQPPRTSMLYITECPVVGGDTVFTNVCEAYKMLRKHERDFFSELEALHIAPGQRSTIIPENEIQKAVHPVIITRPETGEKLIYVNEFFTLNITDISLAESNQILSKLFYLLLNHRLSCRFRWTPNTIAWWDNIGTQHQAIWDYYPNTRIGYRVLSKNLY